MITTRRVRPNRTTGLGQGLAAALILSALLAAFPQPAQAAPAGADAARLIAPLAGLMSWIEGFLADLGYSPRASDGPEAAFLPDGGVADPIGGSGTKDLTATLPQPQPKESNLADHAATK